MRRFALALSAPVLLFAAACSEPATTSDAGEVPGLDARASGPDDAAQPGQDAGIDAGAEALADAAEPPGPDASVTGPDAGIAGSMDLDIRVVGFGPTEGASVRVSNAAGNYLDSTTGVDGVARILVDPAAGPFDVTVFKSGFRLTSLINVTEPVGTFYLSTSHGFSSPNDQAITGNVIGARAGGTKLFVDAFSSSNTTNSTMNLLSAGTTAFEMFYSPTSTSPLYLTALEIDFAANSLVNGVRADLSRTGSPITQDLVLPATPPTEQTARMTFELPTTGVYKASDVTPLVVDTLGAGDTELRGFVTHDFPSGMDNWGWLQVLGVAEVARSGATLTLTGHYFGDGLAPKRIYALMGNMLAVRIFVPVADGATYTFPPVDSATLTGLTLGNLRFGFTASGYNGVWVEIFELSPTGEPFSWQIFGRGQSFPPRPLPLMPPGVVGKGNLRAALRPIVSLDDASPTAWLGAASLLGYYCGARDVKP